MNKSIKASSNIMSIIGNCTSLRRVANTGGGEWAGPCPFCVDHGDDRFHVQPHFPDGGRWFCRKCTEGRWQDVINFVMRRDNVDFKSALHQLEHHGVRVPDHYPNSNSYCECSSIDYPKLIIPSPLWQRKAGIFVENSRETLWGKQGQQALAYLSSRGLQESTLQKYSIGLHLGKPLHRDVYDQDLSAWGLSSYDFKSVFLPVGIVIPTIVDGQLWSVQIRRLDFAPTKLRSKYIYILGSKTAIFGANNLSRSIAVFCESRFDAMLVDQEAGDLIGAASLGCATIQIASLDLTVWGRYLLPLKHIYVTYDQDEQGQIGSNKFVEYSHRISALPLPDIEGVNDITDFRKSGGDIRHWIIDQISNLDNSTGSCRRNRIELFHKESNPNNKFTGE